MGWTLAPHVTFCVGSGRIVFLDVARDRYFALPLEQSRAFIQWLSAPDQRPLPTSVELLERAGLLAGVDGTSMIAPPDIARVQRGQALAARWPGLREALVIERSARWVRWKFRRAGLLATLDWLRPGAEQTHGDAARQAAAAFLRIRPQYPDRRACLPDSLALLHYLRRRDIHASIVFGITGMPFRAHCWVQLGDEILNDGLDYVSPYTPILQR